MLKGGALTGRTLGHHTVLEPLGEGGMGVVYKARDTRLGRLVAVKVMRADWAGDADSRRRFLHEAQAASALNHPGIVTIYEIDTLDDFDYIAMEYLEGGTLAGLIARGPLPVERALRLAAQAADALAAAHALRIVHRDLKPSNIMLVAEDRLKLTDFGLAKVVPADASTAETAAGVTAAGAVIGTAPYMSPEQATGRPVDGRSDVFSLGTVLYEMLAGHRPFDRGTAVGTLAAILHDPPPPIVGLSPGLSRLLERCLQKQPGERFQSASELKAALERCLVSPTGGERPSVAVLPFANMCGTADDDYLCEGLAEEIIDALTRLRGLRVIARTSCFAIGRMALDVREIGARLGVDSVLEGSVRRAGRRVRVTVQLVTTSDGSHLWSQRYDRELTDALVLEEEIADAVAARLRVDLEGEARPRGQVAVDPVAHQAYLEGRYYFARGTPDALAQARLCYERAIGRDPRFALAYDSLAELFWYLGFFGGMPPREAFSVSTWHALRALELDDTLAETHALLAMLRKELDYNWPEVDRELERALALNHQSPAVRLRYAISGLLPHGRVEEALGELELILESDPLSVLLRWWVGVMAFLAGRPDRATEQGRYMIELAPAHFLGYWTLGTGLQDSGDLVAAIGAFEQANELSGGMPITLGFLAQAYGQAGRAAEARALLERAAQRAQSSYVPPTVFAVGQAGLGEWDAVLSRLDQAIEMRDPLVMPIKTYPFLAPVRSDPRYHALLRRMNL